MKQPELGITKPVKLVRTIDGDTVVVDLTYRLHVRLDNVRAPELRKTGGQEAKYHMVGLLSDKDVVMHIPSHEDLEIDDSMSFGRVVGTLFVDGEDINEKMNEYLHTLKEK